MWMIKPLLSILYLTNYFLKERDSHYPLMKYLKIWTMEVMVNTFKLSTSNATALKIQKQNTDGSYSDLSSPHTLVAGESTLYIYADGLIDDKGSIKFESNNVGTSTANVNGAISGETALVVDDNAGDIKVGDFVTGSGNLWNCYSKESY